MNRRRKILVVSIAALALALASTAAAGNGSGNGGGKDPSSLSLIMVSDANGNGQPNWGDTVTFKVSTTATSQPSVFADCYQNGAWVYRHYGFFYGDPSPSQNFVLYSYVWAGGAADCTATLYYMDPQKGTEVDLATLPFHVDA